MHGTGGWDASSRLVVESEKPGGWELVSKSSWSVLAGFLWAEPRGLIFLTSPWQLDINTGFRAHYETTACVWQATWKLGLAMLFSHNSIRERLRQAAISAPLNVSSGAQDCSSFSEVMSPHILLVPIDYSCACCKSFVVIVVWYPLCAYTSTNPSSCRWSLDLGLWFGCEVSSKKLVCQRHGLQLVTMINGLTHWWLRSLGHGDFQEVGHSIYKRCNLSPVSVPPSASVPWWDVRLFHTVMLPWRSDSP